MSFESPKDLVPRFFDKTSSTYDKVVNWSTFGKDKYWKNEILCKITPSNSILDLACGTGILTREISLKFPHAKITGVDLTKSYLDIAKEKSSGFQNITFVYQDAENLNLGKKFDCITSSYLPKYCNAEILVKRCVDHLNPGGKIIFHDFIYPKKQIARILWDLYFVFLKFTRFFIPSWREAFLELPKLIKSSNWLTSYENEMRKHGLEVKSQYLTCDTCAILTGTKIS